jgi:hypothetical protein
MIGRMAKDGTPDDTVRFRHELSKQRHGELGIMTGFHDERPVPFAWITYPLRAKTNYGLLLVNGRPRIVNVEDPKLLDVKTMKQVPSSVIRKRNFPMSMSGREIGTERDGRVPNPDPMEEYSLR